MRLCARVAMEESLLSVWVSQSIAIGQSMNIATFSTQDLQEQGHKSYVAIVIRAMKNWWSRERFLVNYINEGDLQKVSAADDSQYTDI